LILSLRPWHGGQAEALKGDRPMKEAIALLEKAETKLLCTDDRLRPLGDIQKALAILKQPKAQPTEFTKKVRLNLENWGQDLGTQDVRIMTIVAWLKEACKQLDTSEAEIKTFADWRLNLEKQAKIDNAIVKDARDRLDESEASRKGLLEELKLIIALLCHPGSFVTSVDIDRAKDLIAKEGKEK